jgi:hypothetical protein
VLGAVSMEGGLEDVVVRIVVLSLEIFDWGFEDVVMVVGIDLSVVDIDLPMVVPNAELKLNVADGLNVISVVAPEPEPEVRLSTPLETDTLPDTERTSPTPAHNPSNPETETINPETITVRA